MSLELLNTIASMTTAFVIAGTAIAALIQLRHMRAGNQISAFLTMRSMIDRPGFRDALSLTRVKLEKMLEDQGFRAYLEGISTETPTPITADYQAMADAARLVGNTYDAMGALVRSGVIDRKLFLEQYCSVIDRDWDELQFVTDYYRRRVNDNGIWDGFEYITVLSRQFLRENPTSYPKDMPRLQIHNPWRT
jgi:hypothetical protein